MGYDKTYFEFAMDKYNRRERKKPKKHLKKCIAFLGERLDEAEAKNCLKDAIIKSIEKENIKLQESLEEQMREYAFNIAGDGKCCKYCKKRKTLDCPRAMMLAEKCEIVESFANDDGFCELFTRKAETDGEQLSQTEG